MRRIDVRLVIGLLLVGASIAGVYGLVAAADRTTAVYAAAKPVAAGRQLQVSDLEVVRVRLAGASVMYVTEGALRSGAVTVRPLVKGELLALAAVGSARDISATTLVLTLTSPLPTASAVGATVDIWSAVQLGQNTFGPPTIMVPRAQISRIIESSGIGSSSQNINVEVIVPRSTVVLVLQAQANGDAISLVPATTAEPEVTRPASPLPTRQPTLEPMVQPTLQPGPALTPSASPGATS